MEELARTPRARRAPDEDEHGSVARPSPLPPQDFELARVQQDPFPADLLVAPVEDQRARRVVVHELGHTIGLLQESPAPEDVMYPTVQVAVPSGRDRQTVQVLYHTAPTIGPPDPR